MNRSVTRSVLSPRSKTSTGCSPRQSRLSIGGAGKKATGSRSADMVMTPARRVSEEDFSRFEKKLDILCQLNSTDDRVTVEKLEQKLKMKNEELEAALCELDETKTLLAHMERKFQQAQKVSERLEKENKAQIAQLDEIRKELMDRRRKSIINRKVLDEKNGENTPPPPSPQNTDTDDENMGNLLLKQGLKREEQLAEEVKRLKEQLEKEKVDYSAAIKDMLVAVKAAVGLKEEAEAELSRIQARALDDGSDAVWANLIRRWNGGTKRHSLLIWAQYKLTPYPSINVANFTDDWKDGKAFCALVHAHRPDLVARSQLQGECNELVEKLAASLALDDVNETLFSTAPDWNRVMNVVFSLYRKFSEEDA